jgi:ACS family hexuronate transporter-like MFS transporter
MKVKGLRWYIIGLIGLATIINYIDRSAINVLWPYIYKEFGITDAESKDALALITNFFLVAYAIGQTVTGKMMDAIGTRLGMAISIVVWSISISLHALAKSLTSFSIFRSMLGISEAGNWPGATKSNAEWFPAKERAIAQGIFGASASMGNVIALPVIAAAYAAYGWQGTFFGIGLLGLLWLLPWLVINKNTPDKHPWLTNEEREYIEKKEVQQGVAAANVKVYSWKELLKFRDTWGIISSRFFIDPIWWMFVTWLPTFLKDQFSFNIKEVGGAGWIPYAFAAIGGITGGIYSSRLVRRGIAPNKARINAITIGSSIMLLSLAITAFYMNELKEHAGITIGLISAALFGFQFLINNLQTLPSDYFHGKNVGTVSGMGGTSAVAGTIILTFLVPALTRTGYQTVFVLAAMMVPLAWLCIMFIRSKNKNSLA